MRLRPIGILIPIALALAIAGCAPHSKQARIQDAIGMRVADLHGGGDSAASAGQGAAQHPVSADENSDITRVSALILAQDHYLHEPITETIATRTIDGYLNTLDPMHLFFLASDVKEFDAFKSTLAAQLKDRGDTSPANTIFARFAKRLNQQSDYVSSVLKSEQFTFDGNDQYVYDRKTSPHPASLDDAKKLWHDRVRYEYLQEILNKQKPADIVKTITQRYTRIAKTIHDYDTDDIFQLYLNAVVHAYDPHSDYFNHSSLDDFDISMRLSLVGIGALLESVDGYCKISELLPGGPAMRSNKIKPGDKIVSVGDGTSGAPVDVVDMKLNRVVELIRGKKGTTVRLTIIPADATDPSIRKTIDLVRDEIRLEEQEAKAKIIDLPTANGGTERLGVIDLPSFYAGMDEQSRVTKSATVDVAKLLKKLTAEKVNGIILDLRRNGGGSLDEAIRLTGLFIKSGPVVQVKDSDGHVTVDKDPDPSVQYDGPMIVLTSRMTASASEILAGALQDYGRALIVGDSSTFGKGTVQAVVNLGPILERASLKTDVNPGALKITIQKFYRPSGASTQLRGVVPEIILPSLNDYSDISETKLDYPLPWDTLPSANPEKLNRVQPYVAALRAHSQQRVAADPDFTYLRSEIERFRTLMAEKSVSMNEKDRMAETQQAEARAAARKKELVARPPLKAKVYLISLKQADMPGLPPPTVAKAGDVATTDPNLTSDDTAAAATDPKVPSIDMALNEAQRILEDFINVTPRSAGGLAVR